MSRIIGLDIGTRRIGIAITDESGAVCFPRTTIEAATPKVLLQKLIAYLQTEQVNEVVAGLPLGEENELTHRARSIQRFCEKLQSHLPKLVMHYIDEFGTTREAQSKIPLRKHRKEKGTDDMQAALIILQRYLGENGIGS